MKTTLIFALTASALLLPTEVMADVVPFSGSTSGSFSAGTPTDLTFTGTSFSGTTQDTVLCAVLGQCGAAYLINLGSFKLNIPGFRQAPDTYNGRTFDLHVGFTVPNNSGAPLNFLAPLTGTVHTLSGGGLIDLVSVTFANPTQLVTFGPGTNGSGFFDLTVHDATFSSLNDFLFGTVYGDITNATYAIRATAVPEPTSVLLFGTVLVGSVSLLRRKRKV